ncbi:MAG: transcription termination factor Rho [Planctomycetota bacterium]
MSEEQTTTEAADNNGASPPKRRRRRRRKRSGGGGNANGGSNGQGTQPTEVNGNVAVQSNPEPDAVEQDSGDSGEALIASGILELGLQADGRIRQLDETYVAEPTDPVVPMHLVERLGLRAGVQIEAKLGKPFGGSGQGGGKKKKKSRLQMIDPKARRVAEITSIEGMDPADYAKAVHQFDDLTTIMPEPRLTLEYPDCPPACRLIDLFCPIGYGTRGMIVSPPKAGKTTLLQNIAFAIQKNHPEVEVYALLIDERPEEVTDFRRNVPCTVWASSNDHPPERHVGLAINAIERCKRHAEEGRDVVVLMDSLTRLGRAFNTAQGLVNTGRTLSGGLDAGALSIPKQLFGAARKFEEGGSLTIIASALVDTGSRGDQVIFEEFKGTGNMEVILDRKIAEQRVFPAIDLAASGTRNEDRLMSEKELDTVTALRRRLMNMAPVMQVDQLLKAIGRFKTNAELVGDRDGRSGVSGGPLGPGARR